MSGLKLRAGKPEDAAECGPILYEAFRLIAEEHNFPPEFPSLQTALEVVSSVLRSSGFYSVVAELEGKIAGSNFLDERATIGGIGPVSVDPQLQNHSIGRALMADALQRAATRGMAGVRLTQSAYHNRSLCLYTKLGFVTREPLSVMQGPPLKARMAGYEVRVAELSDLERCNELCRQVHGFDRARETRGAINRGQARVVLHLGKITGYSTALASFGHSSAESNNEIKALISAADEFGGEGVVVPIRNHELFSWCLGHGLRQVMEITLMTTGLYNEPAAAYLPSVLY